MGQAAEFLMPLRADAIFAMVRQADTSLTPDDYARENGGLAYVQVAAGSEAVTVHARDPATGLDVRVLDTAVPAETVWDSATPALWLRIVRGKSRWGVQVLWPETTGGDRSETVTARDYRVTTTECAGIFWVSDVPAGDADLQVWLESEGDVVHTLESGLTGAAGFADTTYWGARHDVVVSQAAVTRGEATAELSASARTVTTADAVSTQAAVGRTTTYGPHVWLAAATGRSLTSSSYVWSAPVTPPSQSTGAEAAADPFIYGRINPLVGSAADRQRAGVDAELPVLQGDARFALPKDAVSRTMVVRGATAPALAGQLVFTPIRPGDIRANVPAVEGYLADYPAAAIDSEIPPITGSLGAVSGVWAIEMIVAESSWRFLLGTSMHTSDSVTVQDSASLGVPPWAFTGDEATVGDAWDWRLSHVLAVGDAVSVADQVQFRTQAAPLEVGTEVWCVNVDTGASSRYEQYGFNSFFESGGVLYGVAADGVYRLDADADAGNPIESLIYVGQTDFDTNRVKYLPKVYFGGTSSRPIHVQVSADGVDRTYEARNWSSTLDVHRVDCGVGVKANYWGITLKNSGGADYAVDAVMLTPITTLRRM